MTQPPYGEPEQPPYSPDPHESSPYPGYQPPPPPGVPGSPYQAYPAAYPQQPYAYAPPRRSNTTRNVLIAVAVVVVLVCGGAIAGVTTLVSSTESRFDTDYPGSDGDPLTITEGQEFEIRGFTYAEGWSLATGASADSAIAGLSATNNRDDDESGRSSLTFTLLNGNQILKQFNCYADAEIAAGRTAALDCGGVYDKLPAYRTLEVYDQSFYE